MGSKPEPCLLGKHPVTELSPKLSREFLSGRITQHSFQVQTDWRGGSERGTSTSSQPVVAPFPAGPDALF